MNTLVARLGNFDYNNTESRSLPNRCLLTIDSIMGKWPIAFAGRVSVAVVIITCMTNCIHSQVLNRFENILNWAAEEEVIYGLAKARISRLKLELRELEL